MIYYYKNFDEALDDVFKQKPYKEEKRPQLPNHFITEQVNHSKFGNGTIIQIDGEKCDVLFDSGITKKLLMRFARLTKIT